MTIIRKLMKILALVSLIIAVGLDSHFAYSVENTVKPENDRSDKQLAAQVTDIYNLIKGQTEETKRTFNNLENLINGQYQYIKNLEALIETQKQSIKNLEVLISTQKQTIENLGATIVPIKSSTQKSKMGFNEWAGVLLGSVAVIVTVLGVGIAIFSFFGYREIMRRSKEIATEQAKEEISKQMRDGGFDETIKDAVNKITYRGIIDSEEFEREPPAESNIAGDE